MSKISTYTQHNIINNGKIMNRPALTRNTSVKDFTDFYWLKAELLDFCRQEGIPCSGSKIELSTRIAHYLETGDILTTKPKQSSKRNTAMPCIFERTTVIGTGWRCSQEIRAFFEQEIGPGFHFNKVMRDFIKNGEGKSLQEAIDAWQDAKRNPASKTEIEPQFEYMRHMRAYFAAHPQASREEALQAWHEKRNQRKSKQS